MKRLNQLITRLFIIALIALAVWVGREHVAKRALESHLTSFVGAQVTIKKLSFSQDAGSLIVNEFEAADPRDEMQNLLQVDAASLELNANYLKDRRLVIDAGRLSEVKLGTPRTRSGKLQRSIFDPPIPAAEPPPEEIFVTDLPAISPVANVSTYSSSQRWKDGLLVNLQETPTDFSKRFETETLIERYSQTWSQRFTEPTTTLQQVSAELAQLEKTVLAKPDAPLNPLRGEKFDTTKQSLQELQLKLEQLSATAKSLSAQAQNDQYELSQTQVRDQRLLTGSAAQQKFDAGLINQILIGKVERELVQSGVTWLKQFRESLPKVGRDFRPIMRGQDLHFGKPPTKPQFEIRSLQVDGAAEFARNRFNFAGTIENITDQPSLHEKPITFNLRAQGDRQIIVSGTIDRRGDDSEDSIKFLANGMPSPVSQLGDRESILLTLSDNCELHVDASINVSGHGVVSGTMVFDFEGVMLHADSVHEVAGGEGTAAVLNETVSGIRSFRVTSNLSGSIFQPESDFVCDLGQDVAVALEKVYADQQQLALRKQENHLKKVVNGKRTQLFEEINAGISGLNAIIRQNQKKASEMQNRISSIQGNKLAEPSLRR